MTEHDALIILNLLPKIGPIKAQRLISVFNSASSLLNATRDELLRVPGVGPELSEILLNWKQHIEYEKEMQLADQLGVRIITRESPEWPHSLTEMHDPPLALYIKGEISKQDDQAIAVIGSRKTTPYGREITKRLSYELASANYSIISGLARGIDSIAHTAALSAHGRTIAVIGSGLNRLYPPENRELAEQISQAGAVVSEFPLNRPPDKQSFPQRNRIVAAWATGTVVTEMPSKSGARITANLATEYGRQVFAIPGAIDRITSAGCNELIREGATLITSAQDILNDLEALKPTEQQSELSFEEVPKDSKKSASPKLSVKETVIYEFLSLEEKSIDEIHQHSGLDVAQVSMSLLSLELQGLIQQHPGMSYTKV